MILSEEKVIRSEIIGKKHIVKFKEPLEFKVEDADDCYTTDDGEDIPCFIVNLEHNVLGYMFADGETVEEAWNVMAENFVFLMRQYGEAEDEKLHPYALSLKQWLKENVTIEEVKK